MSKLIEVIGRALKGTAEAAAPFVLADQQARLLEQRDTRVQQFQEKMNANQQAFQERQATQAQGFQEKVLGIQHTNARDMQREQFTFQGDENQANRDLQRLELDSTIGYRAFQEKLGEADFNLRSSQRLDDNAARERTLDLAEQQFKLSKNGVRIQQMIGAIDLQLKGEELRKDKTWNDLATLLKSEDEDTRQAASDALMTMSGKNAINVMPVMNNLGMPVPGLYVSFRNGKLVGGQDARPQLPASVGGTGSTGGVVSEVMKGQQPKPKPAATTAAGTMTNPAKPTTLDEYNQLSEGDYYVHPDTGKLMRVPLNPGK